MRGPTTNKAFLNSKWLCKKSEKVIVKHKLKWTLLKNKMLAKKIAEAAVAQVNEKPAVKAS